MRSRPATARKEAVASWKHSLDLRPDPAVQQYLAKAQREQSVETDFTQRESSHFVLHYEGKQSQRISATDSERARIRLR